MEWQNTWETEEALKSLAQSSELIEQFLKGQCEENNNSIVENDEPTTQTSIADNNTKNDSVTPTKNENEPTTTTSSIADEDEEDGLQIDEVLKSLLFHNEIKFGQSS